MTKEEAHAFLDSQPGWIHMTTVGGDGYPHTIPLGYFRIDDDVYVSARGKSQRRSNVERNPKVCLTLDTGSGMTELKGLVIRGDAALVDDPDEVLRLARESAKQRGTSEADLPSEVRPGTTYIRVSPRSMVSWDNSRSG